MKSFFFILLYLLYFSYCIQINQNCEVDASFVNVYFPGYNTSNSINNSITILGNISDSFIENVIMIIQVQGGEYNNSNTNFFGDETGIGAGATNISAGYYEFNIIKNITRDINVDSEEISIIDLELDLEYNYSSINNNRFQVIKILFCNHTNITDSELTPDFWDGKSGGVFALLSYHLSIKTSIIYLDGKGFRGGPDVMNAQDNGQNILNNYADNTCNIASSSRKNGFKGESYLGHPNINGGESTYPNNTNCARGAPGNGGGGGNFKDNGGGGGGNGGRGGNGGTKLTSQFAGIGGEPSSSNCSINRIFMGGGGGAGSRNDNNGFGNLRGLNGGGICYIHVNKELNIENSVIIATGAPPVTNNAKNGGGGGGAAGTVVLLLNNDTMNSWGSLVIDLQGGDGSTVNSNHGGGGGGGGGVLISSSTNFTNLVLEGGKAGTTDHDQEDGDDGCMSQPSINDKIPSDRIFDKLRPPSQSPTPTPAPQISNTPTISKIIKSASPTPEESHSTTPLSQSKTVPLSINPIPSNIVSNSPFSTSNSPFAISISPFSTSNSPFSISNSPNSSPSTSPRSTISISSSNLITTPISPSSSNSLLTSSTIIESSFTNSISSSISRTSSISTSMSISPSKSELVPLGPTIINSDISIAIDNTRILNEIPNLIPSISNINQSIPLFEVTTDIPLINGLTLITTIVNEFTEPLGNNIIISPVIDIILIDNFGIEVPLTNNIATICISTLPGYDNKSNSCLSFFDEEDQQWKCEDKCTTKDNENRICGDSDHFTNFAILLTGTDSKDKLCESDTYDYIFNEYWQDLLFIGCIIILMSIYCIFVILFLTCTPIGRKLLFGKEGYRIWKLRNINGTIVVES